MSGTVSRSQGRLTYAPGMRLGSAYPGVMQAAAPTPPSAVVPGVAPVAGGVAPPAASMPAVQSAPPVTVGSRRDPEDGNDGGEGGFGSDWGGPGPSGAPSTGSFLSDLAAFGQAAGPAAAMMAGGPMGIGGMALGLMGAGLMNALGYPETASQFARSVGLRGEAVEAAPVADWGNPATGATPAGGNLGAGSPGGDLATPGFDSSLDAAALSGSQAATDQAALGAGLGNFGPGDMGNLGSGAGTGGNLGSSDVGGSLNDGAGSSSSEGGYGGETAGMGSSESGVGWAHGGYTGSGSDGVTQPMRAAGTVHEGEVVIPSSQVARYGLDPLLMLARGQVAPSRLAMLLRG